MPSPGGQPPCPHPRPRPVPRYPPPHAPRSSALVSHSLSAAEVPPAAALGGAAARSAQGDGGAARVEQGRVRALRRRKRFLQIGFEGGGRSSVKRRQISRVRTSGSGTAPAARRAHRQGSLRDRGAEPHPSFRRGLRRRRLAVPGPRTGVPLAAAPAVGRARRSPPSSGCGWKPANTATFPHRVPATPSALQQRSRLAVTAALLPPRWGLSESHPRRKLGPRTAASRRKSSSLPRASQTFEMLNPIPAFWRAFYT